MGRGLTKICMPVLTTTGSFTLQPCQHVFQIHLNFEMFNTCKKKIKKKNPDTNIIHVFEMLKVLFDFWKIICSHKDCGATFLKLEWTLSLLSVCTGTAEDIPLGETCIQTPSCTQGTSEHPMQWQIRSFRLSGWCVGSFCTWKIKINPKYRKPVKIY